MQNAPGYELTKEVMATADVFLRESQRLFRPHGLTAAQYNVLHALSDAADGLSQRELGDILVVDRSNVTGLLDRLEKAGWVKRSDHPTDRRVYRVSLTPSGRKLWAKVEPRYLEVTEQVTAGLTGKQVRDAISVLKSLQTGAASWRLPG
ncbi:MAG TPA: MarR family transcriptional regulator [Rariglobus sp.]|jgi:DNA-binding MarR family transcriptional regulator|nr:MarR family transcriptional regulator [Rariglobus sp.]